MATPLLYHAWAVEGYFHVKTELIDEAVRFHVRKGDGPSICAGCGSVDVTLEGTREVAVRTVPVGLTAVFLVLHLRMFRRGVARDAARRGRARLGRER